MGGANWWTSRENSHNRGSIKERKDSEAKANYFESISTNPVNKSIHEENKLR